MTFSLDVEFEVDADIIVGAIHIGGLEFSCSDRVSDLLLLLCSKHGILVEFFIQRPLFDFGYRILAGELRRVFIPISGFHHAHAG